MPELTAQPLSPELILVSPPEVAALAREQLPDPPETLSNGVRSEPPSEPTAADPSETTWNDFLADVRNRPAEPVVNPRPIPRPPVRIRRNGRKRLLVAVVGLIGVGAVVGLGWARDRGDQRTGSAASPPPATPHRQAAAPKPAKPSSHAKTTPAPAVTAAPKPKPKAAAKPKPTPAPKKSSKQRAVHGTGFVPTRIWSWAAASGTSAYVVRFVRDGHEVLKTRTGSPRLRLPSSFTFKPGSYRWTVTAIPSKGTSARVIVNSAFTVS
jgi:hypothetical protein